VTTTRGGLGNFGKALANAGVGEPPPVEQPPIVDTAPEVTPDPTPDPAPAPAPEQAKTPVEEPKTEDQGFDVAGPGDPPPTEE